MPVGAKPENRTEEDWTAVHDADTLAMAEVIKADEDRYKRAVAWAKELVKKEDAQADAMRKVAGEDA